MDKKQARDIVNKILGCMCEGAVFDDKTKLIEAGIIDSLVIVEMIMELENTLEMEIDLDLITLENFESVESIAEMLVELRGDV